MTQVLLLVLSLSGKGKIKKKNVKIIGMLYMQELFFRVGRTKQDTEFS